MPKITKIISQTGSQNRVNIHVDDKFLTGLDKFTWISHNLQLGSEISKEFCEKLKIESVQGKAYNKALKLLSYRPQSTKEIWQKLKPKFEPETINQTIAKLKQKGWLNDKEFALAWVKERSQTHLRSRTHLKSELIQKGIAANIISEALSEPELEDIELASAQKLVEKFRDRKTKEQLKAYLARKGFNYSIIKKSLEKQDI